MSRELIIGMAGSGGDGVVAAGESLINAVAMSGYHAIQTKSFGPQIRGGESSMRIRVSVDEILSAGEYLDVAIALDWEEFMKFGGELQTAKGAIIIYDSKSGIAPADIPLKDAQPGHVIAAPIEDLAVEHAQTAKAKNVVVLGLLAGWFGIANDALIAGIRKKFSKKAKEVLEGNEKAFFAGVEYSKQNPIQDKSKVLDAPKSNAGKKMITDGNEIAASAALFAGCEFYGGYPITPSSEVMHTLSREIWYYGGSLLQMEDEIAGLGAAIGASFAGKKVFSATSGPGMSLKSEMIGLASIAELPVVLFNVQRGGPSTGIPTKSEQSDLFNAAFSAHGDIVRPVLAPVNVRDTFPIVVEAFNIAEQYQTPVIILSDQELSQRKDTFDPIDLKQFKFVDRKFATKADMNPYNRFKFTADGISPISYVGQEGGNYLASGIEHNEKGGPTSSGEIHHKMNEKRIGKLNPLKERADLFEIHGNENAKLALISWGSVSGVVKEAYLQLKSEGVDVKLMIPRLVYPIAEKVFEKFFKGVDKGLIVEQSHMGQLYHVLRAFVDVPGGIKKFCKSGSNPIVPSEVIRTLKAL